MALGELDDSAGAGGRAKGRPARRYAFDPEAGYVVGVDAGQHRLSVRVADLRGRVVARAVRTPERDQEDPSTRIALLRESVAEAMASFGAAQERVLVTVVGVPAPWPRSPRPARAPASVCAPSSLCCPGNASAPA